MAWYWIAIVVVSGLFIWFTLSAVLYRQFFKRFYDIVLSLIAIVFLSPLLIFLTVIGFIALGGNPFFTQIRPGKKDAKSGQEKLFRLIKFRTMTNKRDESGKLLPDEKRLTVYGKFLRKTSLDELPELFNILIGDMSIVGPRPQLVKDMVFMTDEQRCRHNVRQGLTGLAQVNGRNNITWEDKLKYDLQYISHITFWGDIEIILKTVVKVFQSADIVREGTASDIDFGDWLLQEGKITQKEYDERLNLLREYNEKKHFSKN